MNDEVMPHVDFIAKLELDSIYDLLRSPSMYERNIGATMFGEFLENVHVLQSHGLESFTTNETEPMENT